MEALFVAVAISGSVICALAAALFFAAYRIAILWLKKLGIL
jgi:hypothetical protein